MSLIETGIINVYKPQDWTSHDFVAIMRGVLGIKRVGHTGTLDPMATGVLPICAGPAARVMEYLDLDFKTYECEMQLGLESDTLDIWGEVTPGGDTSAITEEQIQEAFEPFKGTIQQIPPKYSAIKVDGRKLYQYARSGEEVVIKPREVYIEDIEILSIDMEEKKIRWKVVCSKGTYIRSICRDIGDALGCGAVMTTLNRTASGAFRIEDAVDITKVRDMSEEEVLARILPPDYPLMHLGKVLLDEKMARDFCNGHHIPMQKVKIEREPYYKTHEPHIPVREEFFDAYNMYRSDENGEEFLGVAFFSKKYKKLVADKVFYRG